MGLNCSRYDMAFEFDFQIINSDVSFTLKKDSNEENKIKDEFFLIVLFHFILTNIKKYYTNISSKIIGKKIKVNLNQIPLTDFENKLNSHFDFMKKSEFDVYTALLKKYLESRMISNTELISFVKQESIFYLKLNEEELIEAYEIVDEIFDINHEEINNAEPIQQHPCIGNYLDFTTDKKFNDFKIMIKNYTEGSSLLNRCTLLGFINNDSFYFNQIYYNSTIANYNRSFLENFKDYLLMAKTDNVIPSHPTEDGMTLYSGGSIIFNRWSETILSQIGKPIYLMSMLSTSYSPDAAKLFMVNGRSFYKIIVPIRLCKSLLFVQKVSTHTDEKEVILPIGTILKVLSFKFINDTWYIDLEMMDYDINILNGFINFFSGYSRKKRQDKTLTRRGGDRPDDTYNYLGFATNYDFVSIIMEQTVKDEGNYLYNRLKTKSSFKLKSLTSQESTLQRTVHTLQDLCKVALEYPIMYVRYSLPIDNKEYIDPDVGYLDINDLKNLSNTNSNKNASFATYSRYLATKLTNQTNKQNSIDIDDILSEIDKYLVNFYSLNPKIESKMKEMKYRHWYIYNKFLSITNDKDKEKLICEKLKLEYNNI